MGKLVVDAMLKVAKAGVGFKKYKGWVVGTDIVSLILI